MRPDDLTGPPKRRLVRRSRAAVVARCEGGFRRSEAARSIIEPRPPLVPRDTGPPAAVPCVVGPNAYVDYERDLTAEGGIRIAFKTIDAHWRYTVWRVLAWTICTGCEGWFLLYHSPLLSPGLNILGLLVMAIVNWLIVRRPVEIYCAVEIRPDCMIIEGTGIFWLEGMEGEWPAFEEKDERTLVLCGIYGTRFIEYFTAYRFDACDRNPEVLAAHLQEAMDQIWSCAELGIKPRPINLCEMSAVVPVARRSPPRVAPVRRGTRRHPHAATASPRPATGLPLATTD